MNPDLIMNSSYDFRLVALSGFFGLGVNFHQRISSKR